MRIKCCSNNNNNGSNKFIKRSVSCLADITHPPTRTQIDHRDIGIVDKRNDVGIFCIIVVVGGGEEGGKFAYL